ncbi:MAG: GNAT family N-acetyltransferase [Dehalococcoidia bacterium]|nr:GNAT family N-acetyltransferase [Dehalococcoidia bacterium]HRC62165.1 GNAT family N-acetyltransferase [Dehalococcoidia bacterium]
MKAQAVRVALTPIDERELAEFLAWFDQYRHELEPFDPAGPDPHPLSRYWDALRRDPESQELLWIEADGVRAGFLLARGFEDWPATEDTVVDIAECFVAPEFRRRGVGRAAVEAVLERERARGTVLVEASILPGNADALAFWAALGFAPRAIRTARQP